MTHVDWTQVIIALITALTSVATLWIARDNRKKIKATSADLKTPSGDPIGHVAERTHDLAAANMGLLLHKNGRTRDATPADKQELRTIEPQVPETP